VDDVSWKLACCTSAAGKKLLWFIEILMYGIIKQLSSGLPEVHLTVLSALFQLTDNGYALQPLHLLDGLR